MRRLAGICGAIGLLAGFVSGMSYASASPAGTIARSCSDPAPGHYSCFSLRRTDVHMPFAGTPSGLTPADLRDAYQLPTGAGTGQRIYVVDAFDVVNAESDLAAYRSAFGLPPCTTANGCFQKLNQDGLRTPLPAQNSAWAGETALDLDMVSAACPNCYITLIEATDDSDNLFTAVSTANRLGAKFVSLSWGGDEVSGEADYDSYFLPGVAYLVASGDSGYAGGVHYPSASPNVVSVGGTTLSASGNTRGWSESVWAGGTESGCSRYETKPTWQTFISAATCSRRAVNDLSVVGDPSTGVAVYSGGAWTIYGGTSAGAPLVAGMYALAGTPGASDNPAAYPYQQSPSFFDITSGSNGSCSGSVLCTARAGWDGPTGIGTPNGVGGLRPAAPSGPAGSFVSISPNRILDTRSGVGAPRGLVPSGGNVHLGITGSAGLPYTGVSAVVVNLTVTQPSKAGFLTAYPDGGDLPVVSNLNFSPGQDVANLAVVPIGADGRISLYLGMSAGSAYLVADVTGYYVGGTPTVAGAFGPVAPARILDTRSGLGAGAGAVAPGGVVHLAVAGVAGVPSSGVAAVSVNITVTGAQTAGFVTAYPDGSSPPAVSNLNFAPGQTVANLAVVRVGGNGAIALLNASNGGTTQLIVDITGYYLSTGGGSGVAVYHPLVAPVRDIDTRDTAAVGSGTILSVLVAGVHGVPASASAVVVNITVTASQSPGYLTAWAHNYPQPTASNLNFTTGQTVAGLAIVPVGTDGAVAVFNGSNGGTTQVIVDVAGYYLGG